jgi:2-polyprenyl-3-methyl-5-hydroxy-6-metoxy-1,4-benzoquinol methylase
MKTASEHHPSDHIERARQSLGQSEEAIYRLVAHTIEQKTSISGTIIDVGCGSGNLHPYLQGRFSRYVGVDALRYEKFPRDAELVLADLNSTPWPLAEKVADVVAAIEVIEHLENPRAFFRELVRLVKPGGLVLVTTPNQQSFLSLFTLIVKGRFSAFQDIHYPAHLTALLEIDLRRIAVESSLTDIVVEYSLSGRIILTPWHYPQCLTLISPRTFSDNLLLVGRMPLS